VEKRGRGRPRGSENKIISAAAVASSSVLVKQRPGRLAGSKNKPKAPLLRQVQVLLPLMLLLLRPKSIPSSASATRSAAKFSACH
jgi:hypothetical protein